jgi:tyrosyl-tRNA synthetase
MGKGSAADDLVAVNLVGSKSEARRLINENAVEINGKKVSNPGEVLTLKAGDIIKVGKKKSVKVV